MRVVLWGVTLLRVALIPWFVYFAAHAQEAGRLGADASTFRAATIVTLVVIGFSDVLDGWLARHFDLRSQLGATVDAVADKLAQFTLVAFFTLSVGPVFPTLPFWFLIVVFGRDLVLLVGVLMLRARYGPLKVEHRGHGRLATITMSLLLFWTTVGLPGWGLLPLMVLTAGLSVVSATVYALDGAAQGSAMVRDAAPPKEGMARD